MMMPMAMRILFARTIMVIIRLAGDDQNYPFFKDPDDHDDPFFFKDPGDCDHLYVWEEQQGTQESFWRLESCS